MSKLVTMGLIRNADAKLAIGIAGDSMFRMVSAAKYALCRFVPVVVDAIFNWLSNSAFAQPEPNRSTSEFQISSYQAFGCLYVEFHVA